MKALLLVVAAIAVTACASPPPANPMERHARLAAGAELAAQRCPGQLGGYQSAVQARQDANRNIAIARQLGATDEDIEKERRVIRQSFEAQAVWTTPLEACNSLVGSLAWATG